MFTLRGGSAGTGSRAVISRRPFGNQVLMERCCISIRVAPEPCHGVPEVRCPSRIKGGEACTCRQEDIQVGTQAMLPLRSEDRPTAEPPAALIVYDGGQ